MSFSSVLCSSCSYLFFPLSFLVIISLIQIILYSPWVARTPAFFIICHYFLFMNVISQRRFFPFPNDPNLMCAKIFCSENSGFMTLIILTMTFVMPFDSTFYNFLFVFQYNYVLVYVSQNCNIPCVLPKV